MYRRLGCRRLTSGEAIEVGVVEAPAPAWADRLLPFLSHKGGDYGFHLRAALAGRLDELETRFYVATIAARPIAQAMVVGARGFGILAHVYTDPAWRRRGAIHQIFALLMVDVCALGLRAVTLSTAFDSVPFWIYHRLGFRPVAEGSGNMLWLAEPEADHALLAATETSMRPTRWSDWAAYSFATLRPVAVGEALPRSPAVGVVAQGSAEWGFLGFVRALDPARGHVSRVLLNQRGAIVGWCHVGPGPAALGGAWLLDLHVLPGFAAGLPALLAGVVWPRAPVVFHATGEVDRGADLQAHGFAPVAALPRVVASGADTLDLHLWVRPSAPVDTAGGIGYAHEHLVNIQ